MAVKLTKERIGGVWIPQRSQEIRTIGVVIKVGPEVKHAEVGEVIIFQYGTCEIRPEGREEFGYDIMTDEAVLASVEL